MFSGSFEGHYHPLTLISLSADNFFFGLSPKAFHIHNLILHLVNTCLVFLFLQKLLSSGQPNRPANNYFTYLPVFVASLFAVHSMNVEAIAWATARKDVLFSFWFLLSLVLYLDAFRTKKKLYYYLSVFAFLLACLSKGQAFVLPFCLIAIDYFLKEKQTLAIFLKNKIAYLLIAVLTAAVAIYAQKETGYTSKDASGLSTQEFLVYPSLSLILYLSKIVLPLNLSAYYPYPESADGSIAALLWLSIPLALAFLSIVFFALRKNRLIAFALLFFVINIFMFLKWIPVSNYIIADRYTYLAGIGIFILAAYGLNELIIRKPKSKLFVGALLILLFSSLSWNTYNRCKVWENSLTLLNDILAKNPRVYTALNSRGDVFASEGDTASAMRDFNMAIQLRPQFSRAYGNRGTLLAKTGDCKRALTDFNKSLKINPSQPAIYANRARCLNLNGEFNAALADLEKSARLGFNNPMLFYETGIAWYNLKDFNKAILEFNKVEKLAPEYPSLHMYRGYANFNSNDMPATISDLNIAIAKGSVNPVSIAIRGMAKVRSGDKNGGCEDLSKAREMGLTQAQGEIERYCR